MYMIWLLVVVIGENVEFYMFDLFGLYKFYGVISYGLIYCNGVKYKDMKVLVVGVGNIGMEILFDLVKFGVKLIFVVCSKVCYKFWMNFFLIIKLVIDFVFYCFIVLVFYDLCFIVLVSGWVSLIE